MLLAFYFGQDKQKRVQLLLMTASVSTIFFERTRKGHRQSDQYCNYSRGDTEETSERRAGAHMGFSERVMDAILNWI